MSTNGQDIGDSLKRTVDKSTAACTHSGAEPQTRSNAPKLKGKTTVAELVIEVAVSLLAQLPPGKYTFPN